MDLLQEARKANKEAFNELVDKYNIIFYKTARLYFYTDDEIKPMLNESIGKVYKQIINARTEEEFLILALKILVQDFQLETKKHKDRHKSLSDISITIGDKITSSTNDDDIHAYERYRKESILEEYLTSMKEQWRLPAFLYYYCNLDIKDIDKISKSAGDTLRNDIEKIRIRIYEMIKNKEVDL